MKDPTTKYGFYLSEADTPINFFSLEISRKRGT